MMLINCIQINWYTIKCQYGKTKAAKHWPSAFGYLLLGNGGGKSHLLTIMVVKEWTNITNVENEYLSRQTVIN